MSAPCSISVGDKVLVTTDGWFFAPDGRQYRGVFGTVMALDTAEATLGIRPNGRSTNWYLQVGCVLLAGCQVHYVVRSDFCERTARVPDYHTSPEHGCVDFDRPNTIYFADPDANAGRAAA